MAKAAKLGLGILLVTTAVAAQPSTPEAPSLPTTIEVMPPTGEAVNPEAMFANARGFRQRIDDAVKRITSLLEEARRKRDIIMVNCLADKLVQARTNRELSERSYLGMQQDMGGQNEAGAFGHYRRMTVANLNVQVIATEAETCVGEDYSMVSGIKVDVRTEGVPPGDFTQPDDPKPPEIIRPPHASPYY